MRGKAARERRGSAASSTSAEGAPASPCPGSCRRGRFAILVAAARADLRLLAEVVWTSLTPGRDPESAVYGLRWIEYLSGQSLEAMLPLEKPQAQETPAADA